MDKRKVIYYTDELHDEFSTFETTPPKVDGSYDYERKTPLKRFLRFFLYRIVMYPVVVFYARVIFRQKIVGKEKLKPYLGKGFFLYGNHTQPLGDALLETRLVFPKSSYVIVHPNNLAVPVLGKWTPALGGLPLPDGMQAYRNFLAAIRNRIAEGHPVVIYPEAHIWPYYTKIRPFLDTSFAYPVSLGVPAFCFVNTYKKTRIRKRPKMVTYIDGPFFPPEEGEAKTKKKLLRDAVYARMTELSKRSDVEIIRYVKKEESDG
jgi:1-acyl-sn-glycerol-3-phosphate acyltransferase